MNRYILQPEDSVELLPPEDGAGAAIRVFCERTMIFFDVSALESVCVLKNSRVSGGADDFYCFRGPDALLAERHEVLLPVSRPDAAAFWDALRRAVPELDCDAEEPFAPETCDHTGRRHSV